jgi:IclR family pca regulon transcriptional regulator
MPAYVMTSGRVLLSGKTDEEIVAALAKMDLKPLTQKTRTDAEDLLNLIADIRQAGFAAIDSELEEGLLSLAVPIRDRRGGIVASLNVSSSASRITLPALCDLALPVLRRTVEAIAHALP